MSRILYLMPGIEVGEEDKARRQRIATGFLTNPANSVTVDECDEGPISIESVIENALSVRGMLEKALKLKGQYDALIVGCAGDPGLYAMRELLDVPVVGPLESSAAMASTIGDRFSVVTILDAGIPEFKATLRTYGQADKCASVRAVNMHVLDMVNGVVDRKAIVDAVSREAEKCIAEGASSVILGCMTLAFTLLDEEVHLDAPILNPVKIAVKFAEMQAAMGLKHSVVTYPKPDLDKLRRTLLPGI